MEQFSGGNSHNASDLEKGYHLLLRELFKEMIAEKDTAPLTNALGMVVKTVKDISRLFCLLFTLFYFCVLPRIFICFVALSTQKKEYRPHAQGKIKNAFHY